MHNNFIVANYAADGGCLDNDDGSSYYNITRNFCVYGGHKSDFDGHDKYSSHNLHVFPSVYGTKCVAILQDLPPAGYAEAYTFNRCVLPSSGSTYLELAGCRGHLTNSTPDHEAISSAMRLGKNTVYVPNGDARVSCGGYKLNLTEFLSRGYDVGTAVLRMMLLAESPLPSTPRRTPTSPNTYLTQLALTQ